MTDSHKKVLVMLLQEDVKLLTHVIDILARNEDDDSDSKELVESSLEVAREGIKTILDSYRENS